MDIFHALADPTRRHIIELLAQRGQLSASDISENFEISAPAISQHLKILRTAKLVDMEKHAQQRIYRINPAKMSEIEQWVHQMKHMWTIRFETLDLVLKKEKKNLKTRKGVKYGKSK